MKFHCSLSEAKCFETIGLGSSLKDAIAELPSLEQDIEADDNCYSSQSEPGILFAVQEGLEEDLHKEHGRIEYICIFQI